MYQSNTRKGNCAERHDCLAAENVQQVRNGFTLLVQPMPQNKPNGDAREPERDRDDGDAQRHEYSAVHGIIMNYTVERVFVSEAAMTCNWRKLTVMSNHDSIPKCVIVRGSEAAKDGCSARKIKTAVVAVHCQWG